MVAANSCDSKSKTTTGNRVRLSRTLTVKGDPELGLPTAKDEEIYLGLMKYTSDYNGFAEAKVVLQRSALFTLMGWPKSDWAYARLTLGMQRLVGVRLSYQNMWRDNRDKQYRDQGAFGILDSFHFRDQQQAGGSYAEHASVFRWSQVLFQSFDSGYLKRIDFGLQRGLSTTACSTLSLSRQTLPSASPPFGHHRFGPTGLPTYWGQSGLNSTKSASDTLLLPPRNWSKPDTSSAATMMNALQTSVAASGQQPLTTELPT